LKTTIDGGPDSAGDFIGSFTLRVTSLGVVPEPGTWSLVGAGGLFPALGRRALRRRTRRRP